MSKLLENVARARDQRHTSEQEFRKTLVAAKKRHSWAEIAAVLGMSRHGARYLAANLNERRQEKRKR